MTYQILAPLKAGYDEILSSEAIAFIVALEQRFGIEFSRYFAESLQRLQSLAADGLVTVSDSVVAATARGRLLLRNIAMCFDRYLQEPRATHARAI